MNRKTYRLVFSQLRNMLVAVEETVAATGKQVGETPVRSRKSQGVIFSIHATLFTLRQIALAALALLGALPSLSGAQIVPGGAHAPSVIQTQNGLDQVNINRPSGAGVSMNTYGQFDVQPKGAILNNSPVIVQTQQAGMINGNPHFGPGQPARVIVNQVNSSAASQINGHLEVAGQRAEVVIANGSGISVNGGGFINTSRAILTTGTPNFAPDGSLSGFNVTGGNISIQGAGLNAGDTGQVDLLARAVQANAAIYAKNLNVVTGANSISHDTLNATPVAGNGPAPGVSIDVSQLGGMYANRIVLVGTENGVGVSNKGVLAAQAGDLVLSTNGLLTLAGQTNASGNMALSAAGGIDNSGTTYAQQSVTANTSGALTNSGVLAAQQNAAVNAASVASTGTLGAGVNGDGSLAQSGDLSVTAGTTLTATGGNAAGGNATLNGASVNLAGSSTSANGALALTASGGDLNLSGATVTAGGALDTRASGTLTNVGGTIVSNGQATLQAGTLDNTAGSVIGQNGLTATVGGALDNTNGRLLSNTDLSLASGTLNNNGGQIGAGANETIHAGSLINAGDGGFNVNVKGNTDLKGATIASTATPDKNSLTTGTLTFSDFENSSSYDAKSSGISAGASMGLPDKAVGPASVPNSGGITPSLGQHDSGNDSATTRSGVSAGAINITDTDHQTQDVASLNRGTSDTNGTVAKTPDVDNLLERQADMMGAASAAGQAVATQIGNYADLRLQEARDAGDQAGIAAWSEGGSARVAMHTAGGALAAGLGGGNALGGAAGAATAAVLAGNLNGISNAVYDANPTGDADANRMLGNILANVLAGSAGALVGGNSGAFAGANEDLYNRSTSCNGAHCDDSNAIGKRSDPADAFRIDLVSRYCGAGNSCTDAQLKQVMQAQADMAKAVGETPLVATLSPNYATVGAGSLSGAVGGAVNLYDGAVYTSYSVSQSFPPASWAPGATATFGWIWGARNASSTNAFMNGDGNQFYVSIPLGRINLMGAVTHAYGGSTAIELGITSPGGITAGIVPWSHSTPLNEKK
ncbi:filamentous hemagglutinin family protein [Paraburkholderia sp. GAS42]